MIIREHAFCHISVMLQSTGMMNWFPGTVLHVVRPLGSNLASLIFLLYTFSLNTLIYSPDFTYILYPDHPQI